MNPYETHKTRPPWNPVRLTISGNRWVAEVSPRALERFL
jgi:hypothetical protein